MPISRVRSVTETSMMFMMPTPPDDQRDAGHGAEEQGHHHGDDVQHPGDFGGVSHGEIVFVARADVVPLPQEIGDFIFGLLHLIGRAGRDEDAIDVIEIAAADLFLDRGERGQDDVVLVLAEEVGAFRLQQADHSEGDFFDADRGADAVHAGKQVVGHGFADDADLGRGVDIGGAEEFALVRPAGCGWSDTFR